MRSYKSGRVFVLSELLNGQEHAGDRDCLKQQFGIYELVLISDDRAPKALPRALGEDNTGTLYIGRSGTTYSRSLLTRIKEFWSSIVRGAQVHTAGNHYHRADAEGLAAVGSIGVRIWTVPDPARMVKREEERRISAYVKRHKELPPFNHSWPKER